MLKPRMIEVVALAVALVASGCSEGSVNPVGASQTGGGGQDGVTVVPPSARLPTYETQAFAATPPTVVWGIQEGSPAGGQITQSGLYQAPGTAGSYHVTVFEPVSAITVIVPITVYSTSPGTSHGITIPTNHPRIWFDGPNGSRIAAARTWLSAHPYTPNTTEPTTMNEVALHGMLTNNASECRTAINSVFNSAWTPQGWNQGGGCGNNGGDAGNNARWWGEDHILVWDWCYPYFTAQERTNFIAQTNNWMTACMNQTWGSISYLNNYYWGFVRNQLLWGIASYEENTTAAEQYIDNAVARLENYLYPGTFAGQNGSGGVGQEGSQYGIDVDRYPVAAFITAGMMGRDFYSETNFWKEAIFPIIYGTTLARTTCGKGGENLLYSPFPNSDDQFWHSNYSGSNGLDDAYGTFFLGIANRWPNTNVGGYARQFLAATAAPTTIWAASTDVPNTPRSFTNLPLDYWADGVRWGWAHTSWSNLNSTIVMVQAGDRDFWWIGGHAHQDWGTFQIWRNGRYLSRESVSYGTNVPAWHGSGTEWSVATAPHNSVLVNGQGIRTNTYADLQTSATVGRIVDVTRVESQPGYFYVAADLGGIHSLAAANPNFVAWVREYLYFRGLETLVVFDRIQSLNASDTKTFLLHSETNPTLRSNGATITNGSNRLDAWTLLPASNVSVGVVNEGSGDPYQYRIEIDTTPGAQQSYMLTVLQAHDNTATTMNPTVVDNGTSYTLTLDGSNSVTFDKGMVSLGGSVTAAGVSNDLRTSVQTVSVTDAGPAWGP